MLVFKPKARPKADDQSFAVPSPVRPYAHLPPGPLKDSRHKMFKLAQNKVPRPRLYERKKPQANRAISSIR